MGWTERVLKSGFWQHGLFQVLYNLTTNFNAVLTKLDTENLGDSNYSSLLAISSPTIGSTGRKQIQPNGMLLGDVVLLCKNLRGSFNLLMDKLAADGTVNGTTAYTTLKFGATTDLIDVSNARVKQRGIHDDALVQFLDDLVNKWDTALGVLDGDSGVADTNYESLYRVSDTVGASSSSSSSRSSSSSSRSSSSSSCSSSSCRSSSSSCSSSCSSSSSSSRSSSSSSRSSSSSSSSSSSRSSSSSSKSSSSSSSSSRSSSSSSSCSSSSCSSSSSSSSSRSSSSSSSSSQAIN